MATYFGFIHISKISNDFLVFCTISFFVGQFPQVCSTVKFCYMIVHLNVICESPPLNTFRLMQKHVGSSKRFYGDELRRSVSRRRNAVFACARTRVSTVGFVTKRVSSHFDGVERLRREQVINSPSATVKLNNPQACINYYPRKSYHSHICKQLIHSEIIWIIFYTTLTKNCNIFF